NGGWVSALFPVGPDILARRYGEAAARAQLAAMRDTVDEVGRVVQAEGIDAGFLKSGTLVTARGPAQVTRAREDVEASRYWGSGTTWLGPGEARDRIRMTALLGATFNPNCARVQPFRLAVGLGAACVRLGVDIREGSPVADAGRGLVRTVRGPVVRARHVIRATEAWTARLPRLRRHLAPVYSLVVATEPLPASAWDEIGLAGREVFGSHQHVIVYGQRCTDDRLVFGGRGAPYHLGSGIGPDFDEDETVFASLRRTVGTLFPVLREATFTHCWGGPLGVARDWHPAVHYDPASGVGWAGGYVGDGVATANLAGRTLADLVTGRSTPLTALPWVGHDSPLWEPEPARWLGVNAGLQLARLADMEERITGHPALLGRAVSALTGH
ncbi:MAG TPA: FAD-dependent oxidoreductase, partial [Candidatus Lustribacter sp.]|nr:FAD-dependent oxidoreductase [Candidatus Lustribacter sp.]